MNFEDLHPELLDNQRPFFAQKQDIKDTLLKLSEIERTLGQWNLIKDKIDYN